IDTVFGLAGWSDAEGGELRFALFTVLPEGDPGRVGLPNRDALDAVATAMHGCGQRLANG
ncbi:MAG: hypothetical protein GXX90_08945, partial [Microbacteriaceae bacterium]|nr:hypothetical protein [Microbacteriaceae bacterium]